MFPVGPQKYMLGTHVFSLFLLFFAFCRMPGEETSVFYFQILVQECNENLEIIFS